jgi:hypothetical protein
VSERDSALAAREGLAAAASALGADEVRVLTHIARRLSVGAALYGSLDLARDRRAFRNTEAREEIEDALFYLACARLTQLDGGSQ